MHTQDLPNTQTGSAIAFRALAVKERRLDEELIAKRLERAAALRGRLFEGLDTNGAPGGGVMRGVTRRVHYVLGACFAVAPGCCTLPRQHRSSCLVHPCCITCSSSQLLTGYRLVNGEGDSLPGLVRGAVPGSCCLRLAACASLAVKSGHSRAAALSTSTHG